MTIGIYALYWEIQDLIYIGQSVDVESRKRSHFSNMRLGTHRNYKVQNTYDKYGYPELVVLEVCKSSELDTLEIHWTNEFSDLNTESILCIAKPGAANRGTEHNSSTYSRMQILKVFSLLYKGVDSVYSINSRTKVSVCNIRNILNGSRHLWLREEYPVEYSGMMSRPKTVRRLSSTIILISPAGTKYTITNIKEFSNSIDIPLTNLHAKITGFTGLIYGRRNSYKGWKIFKD